MSDPRKKLAEIEFNGQDLWREEMYTDRAVGSIRALVPVGLDGQPDLSRKTEYYVQTQVMTGGGPIPVEGPIEANSLEEAVARFGEAAQDAIEEMIARAREYQREAASQIVTPGQALGGGLGGLGGAPAPGKNPFTLL